MWKKQKIERPGSNTAGRAQRRSGTWFSILWLQDQDSSSWKTIQIFYHGIWAVIRLWREHLLLFTKAVHSQIVVSLSTSGFWWPKAYTMVRPLSMYSLRRAEKAGWNSLFITSRLVCLSSRPLCRTLLLMVQSFIIYIVLQISQLLRSKCLAVPDTTTSLPCFLSWFT